MLLLVGVTSVGRRRFLTSYSPLSLLVRTPVRWCMVSLFCILCCTVIHSFDGVDVAMVYDQGRGPPSLFWRSTERARNQID